jgi:hypothetical protein
VVDGGDEVRGGGDAELGLPTGEQPRGLTGTADRHHGDLQAVAGEDPLLRGHPQRRDVDVGHGGHPDPAQRPGRA